MGVSPYEIYGHIIRWIPVRSTRTSLREIGPPEYMKEGESELKFVSNQKSARERAVQVLSEEIVEYLESQDIMFVERGEAVDTYRHPQQVKTDSETRLD